MNETSAPVRRPLAPQHLLAYVLSLPERIVRLVLGGVAGLGLLVARLLPRPIREGKLYRVAVERHLRVLSDEIGRARRFKEAKKDPKESVARMAVGGVADNLLTFALHASPVWVLLAASDVSRAAQAFTTELGQELQDAGVMAPGSRLDSVDDILGGLSRLSARLAETVDTPPLSLTDMRETVGSVQKEIETVGATAWKEAANVDGLARDLQALADQAQRPLLEVCAGVAVGSVRKAGALVWGGLAGAGATAKIAGRRLWSDVVLDYEGGVRRMIRRGFYGTLRHTLRPHARSYRTLFAYRFLTFTEMGLCFGAWRTASWRRTRGG